MAAVDAFKTHCLDDAELRPAMDGAPFLQGSVADGTVIRPVNGDEFDVDVVYPCRRLFVPGDGSPLALLNWFEGRLRQREFYDSNMIRKTRCVRINYAGDFHMDIIPAAADVPGYSPYAIPARDLKGWMTNDPQGWVSWIAGLHRSTAPERFVFAARFLKRWAALKTGSAPPPSILLLTLMGNSAPQRAPSRRITDPLFPTHTAHAAYMFDMVRLAILNVQGKNHRAFQHPTIRSESVSPEWRGQHLKVFHTKLASLRNALSKAIYSRSQRDAVLTYRSLFGTAFPEWY